MSVDKAKEFLIKASTDEDTATKVEKTYLASLLAVAGDLGFELREDELMAAMEDLSSFGELSEQELDQITGAKAWNDTMMFSGRRLPGALGRLGKGRSKP
jgi:predicted ribosomally synthesized peptide with nif11-like leader